MISKGKGLLLVIALLLLSVGVLWAAGESQATDREEFPTKAVTIVAAANPGGGTDTAARLAGDALRPHLDQPVVIDNKAGAGGLVGAQYVLNQRPDGYTMYMGTYGGLGWIIDHIMDDFEGQPVGMDELKPVFGLSTLTAALAVPVDSPFESVDDIVEHARANPGRLRWTSPGRPSGFWFAGAALIQETGIDVVEIPGAGGAAALQMVGGGEVDFGFLATFLAESVRDENVRILAVWHHERDPIVPDVPTLGELGYDVIVSDAVKIVAVPVDVPDWKVDVLWQGFQKGAEDARVEEAILASGSIPLLLSPEESQAYLDRNIEQVRSRIDDVRAIMGSPEGQ